VPYIVRWPGRVPQGRTTAQLAITMDWVATFLEAAGVAPHPDYALDGISLVPVLDDPSTRIERDLYWRMKFRNQKAMRSGDWKYLSLDGDEFLFDLSADQRERANRGRREPERLAAMRARYATWEAAIPPLPADATFSIPYTKADLAQPS
jgi:arylsulfatase A-like enzyme